MPAQLPVEPPPVPACSASASDAAGGAAGLTRQLVQHAIRLGNSVLHHNASISFQAIARNPSLARQARAELDHHRRGSDGTGQPSLPVPVIPFAFRLHSWSCAMELCLLVHMPLRAPGFCPTSHLHDAAATSSKDSCCLVITGPGRRAAWWAEGAPSLFAGSLLQHAALVASLPAGSL